MDYGVGRKRGRPEAAFNGNGRAKKPNQEVDSLSTGIGSKSKPCTKFFSTSGCSFGEACHFLHYVPGGIKAVSQMLNVGPGPALPSAGRNSGVTQSFPGVKNRLCNNYNTSEGCRFGEKCHFAHGEWELGRPTIPSYEDLRPTGLVHGRPAGRPEPSPSRLAAAASFGTSSTAKISVDASLAGAIIGKNGANTKQICHLTGAKLSVREHESDPGLRNIELYGTFDQIEQASNMVHELISNVRTSSGPPVKNHPKQFAPSGNFKSKLCENFPKGSCVFGARCHFAHGVDELRRQGM